MRDSDVPVCDDAKGFWLALLTSAALILAICLFNVAIDPTGEIGFAKTYALNRVMPASAVSFAQNGIGTTAYERTIATTSVDTFLIGTSREKKGFDLCDRPKVLRIAGLGWGIREMAQIQSRILETRLAPATLLIEVGLASDAGRADQQNNLVASYVSLSPRTTLLSIQTLLANLARGSDTAARYAVCRPLSNERVDWATAAASFEYGLRVFDNSEAALRRGRTILEQMIGSANRICARTGIRHTILFFSLPGTPNSTLTRSFDKQLKDNSGRLNEMVRGLSAHQNCQFRYLDLLSIPPGSKAEQRLWHDRGQWLDYTHFSPNLGRIALDEILAVARQEKDGR